MGRRSGRSDEGSGHTSRVIEGSDTFYLKFAILPLRRIGATVARVSRVRSLMSTGFAVEVDRRVVGVAVRVPGGFKFFSSHPDFSPFEARHFRTGRAIGRRLAELARKRRQRGSDGSRLKAAS